MRVSPRVLAPMAGSVRGLRSDPADGTAGPGLAIEPRDGNVSAPISGVVVVARPDDVHLLVAEGDRVEPGIPILDWI